MIYFNNTSAFTKVYFGNNQFTKVYSSDALVWSGGTTPPTPTPYESEYLTFTATESGTFKFSGTTPSATNIVQYSLDSGSTWTTLPHNTYTPTVAAGDKIMWKATATPKYYEGLGYFASTGRFTAEGNPLSLIYGDNFVGVTDISDKTYALASLFASCTGLTSAENIALPATTLSDHCYENMFYNCSSLTSIPELPATILSEHCYASMFRGCSSLTTIPSNYLKATVATKFCYSHMFNSCSGLTTAPDLLSTVAPEGCYWGMFMYCSGLTTAPVLPALQIGPNAYYSMFNNCRNLNSITCLATTIVSSSSTDMWLYNVAASGTFYKNPSMSSWASGPSGVPNGWVVVNAT